MFQDTLSCLILPIHVNSAWRFAAAVFESVKGAKRVVSGETSELQGLEVVDDATLIVRLSETTPLFPMIISGPAAFVLKRSNVESWPVRWTNDNLINFNKDAQDRAGYDLTTAPVSCKDSHISAGHSSQEIET